MIITERGQLWYDKASGSGRELTQVEGDAVWAYDWIHQNPAHWTVEETVRALRNWTRTVESRTMFEGLENEREVRAAAARIRRAMLWMMRKGYIEGGVGRRVPDTEFHEMWGVGGGPCPTGVEGEVCREHLSPEEVAEIRGRAMTPAQLRGQEKLAREAAEELREFKRRPEEMAKYLQEREAGWASESRREGW
jgi:hypothetical protein